ncbi:MAG TPA: DLW-39 family protein [Jiangellales bacterium]|nr:DLW-39 family protein [Jiangellales bacterium]
MNKKVLLAAVAAVAGYVGYKRIQADKAEQDLWAEATDPVPPRDLR